MVHVSLSLLIPNPATSETVDQSQRSLTERQMFQSYYISFVELHTCAEKRDSY